MAPAVMAAALASGAARGAGDGTNAGATKRAARASRTTGRALELRAIFAFRMDRIYAIFITDQSKPSLYNSSCKSLRTVGLSPKMQLWHK